MPVIHEKDGGSLYIVSRLENQKHCTWQITSEGEIILRSFGLSEENTIISKFSLFLLKKNHLIFTNNTGFSDSFTNVKLTDIQKRELPYNERQFISAIRQQGTAARGPIVPGLNDHANTSGSIENKIPHPSPATKAIEKNVVKKTLTPNFRFIDNNTAECLKCHQKHTKNSINKHLLTEHNEEPLLLPEIDLKEYYASKRKKRQDNNFILCPICGVTLKKLDKHIRKVHSETTTDKEKDFCQKKNTDQYTVDSQPGFSQVIDQKSGKVFVIYIGEKCKNEAEKRANELNSTPAKK